MATFAQKVKRYKKQKTVKIFKGKSLADQSHKDSTLISNIMARHSHTGFVQGTTKQPNFGDFVGKQDFQTMQNNVLAVWDMFEDLPSDIRIKFANDPAKLLEFVENKDNYEAIKEMGLSVDHLPEPPKPSPEPLTPDPTPTPTED